ncbi:MAG TPA: tetratricopeptide repeat protein [Candidatus Krumholzibacteria bacterium]|nr:tetratricopeptide repeat protein [Candidatus Krumholzibacteria bacterium]
MTRALLVLCAILPAAACAPVDGPLARYRLEQKVWKAQFHERRINISFMRASTRDTQMAIAAFRDVLASDPLADGGASSWDGAVVDDIRDLQVASRIALASLYFLSERYADAGTLYRSTIETGNLTVESSLEARLGAARSLYLSGEMNEVMEQCAAIFRELSGNPDFISGQSRIDPVFMNVPVALVRMYDETGDTTRTREFSRLAIAFYDRLAAGSGGPETAFDAQLGGLQVCLAVQDWPAAITRLEALLADPLLPEEARPGLELLRGEVYAFPLRAPERAAPMFESISASYPNSGFDFAARYDIGVLRAQSGDEESAMAIFRAIEQENSAPAAVASRAMFARARILERRGQWDDAYELYRRVEQLYPYTPAAIEAPMVVTKHFMASGETALARRTLDRSRDYYLSLLDRGSPFPGDRLVVQAALTESYLAAGEAADVAELLGAGSPEWDATSTAAGMLRSADVYASVLGDSAQAVRMLKKCVERFPETRYANVAQRRLDELAGRSE